jgi:hypothetical protein
MILPEENAMLLKKQRVPSPQTLFARQLTMDLQPGNYTFCRSYDTICGHSPHALLTRQTGADKAGVSADLRP